MLMLDMQDTSEQPHSQVVQFLAGFDFHECAREVLSTSESLKEVEVGMLAHPIRGTVTAQEGRD